MKLKFNDRINGIPCVVTVETGKNAKVLSVKGIDVFPDAITEIYESECSRNCSLYREYSENERAKFFRGRPITVDPREELKKLYSEWDYSYKNGTSDPNWCDGTGLNNIRRNIEIYKEFISQLCLEEEYPPCYYDDLPKLVSSDYMANKDALIETGQEYAKRLEKEPFFKEVILVANRTEPLYKAMCRADKWGSLRNIHWKAKFPEIFRDICNGTKLHNLKMFRKTYECIVEDLKNCLAQAIEDEKKMDVRDCMFTADEDENEDATLEECRAWHQMTLFDFITV